MVKLEQITKQLEELYEALEAAKSEKESLRRDFIRQQLELYKLTPNVPLFHILDQAQHTREEKIPALEAAVNQIVIAEGLEEMAAEKEIERLVLAHGHYAIK